MTRPAPQGAPRPAPTGLPTDEIHPDVIAYAATRGITRPRDLRYLQRQYEREMSARIKREDAATEWASVLTRTVGRRGSRAVDGRVGDLAARDLDRR